MEKLLYRIHRSYFLFSGWELGIYPGYSAIYGAGKISWQRTSLKKGNNDNFRVYTMIFNC
jgi:hypothetical protein